MFLTLHSFQNQNHLLRLFVLYIVILGFNSISQPQIPAVIVATPEKIADGFQFVEGPVWLDGVGLLFSDISANTVYRWTPAPGVAIHLQPSGNSNGLALDSQKRLLLAQHGNRRIARLETNGVQTPLATHFNGKRLNSPNDMAIKSDGAIFFTDPPYGISQNQQELGFSGIYRIGHAGSLSLLDKTLARPNGLAFSPDESLLYVGDAETRRIYIWDVVHDSLLANKRQFAYMSPAGYTDGMKVDASGNLFATGPGGVWVYAGDGRLLQTIPVPGQTTNCNWGDADRQTLYITSGAAIYKVRSPFTGISPIQQKPDSFDLLPVYPNPFNPTTKITFSLSVPAEVTLKIYSLKGEPVGVLTDGMKPAGIHSLHWDAQQGPSGIYYFVLQTGRYKKIQKALFIK